MATRLRGVSSVVGTVLLVALVAVLATGVLAAGTAMESLDDPPPSTVVEGAAVTSACTGCGSSDQVVRLRHVSGDAVQIAAVEVVVALPEHNTTGRLVDLPLATNCLRDSHVEGTDIFDGRCGRVSGPITAVGAGDTTWDAGERLIVRVPKRAVRFTPGDTVVVRVVHMPSGTVVATETLAVVE